MRKEKLMGPTVANGVKYWYNRDGGPSIVYHKIFSTETSSCTVIRPDRDGLGLVEIIQYDDQNNEVCFMTLPPSEIPFVVEALKNSANEVKNLEI